MTECTAVDVFWEDIPGDVALDRYRTLIDAVDVGIYQLDAEGRFLAVNGGIVELSGYSREELIGAPVSKFLNDEDITRITQEIATRLETGEPRQEIFEFTTYTAEGSAIHCELQISLLGEEGEFQGTVGTVRDITDRKVTEQQLRTSNERLDQFASALSHDLREPLRIVVSYLHLLENRYADDLDEDGREFIGFAVDGADRMRKMINGLLKLSRVPTVDGPFGEVDLNEVIADIRHDMQVRITTTDAEITAEELPRVYGDGIQLRQLFQNLIQNALEYSGDEPPRIGISAERDGAQWAISMEDEGIGIPARDHERVFEVFQRAHTQNGLPGTGIGLALCQRIVERHGGEIWIESEPDEGTTVHLILPAIEHHEQ